MVVTNYLDRLEQLNEYVRCPYCADTDAKLLVDTPTGDSPLDIRAECENCGARTPWLEGVGSK